MEQSRSIIKQYIRWFSIRLALIVYDIAVVNLSYFGALVVRFYVSSQFLAGQEHYIPAFQQFAPYYTAGCLVIFGMFRLYSSRLKYAGTNDLLRILMANLVTVLFQVVGSAVFVMRMPVTYYLIGAVLQFVLIALSRTSYRFVAGQWDRIRKLRNKTAVNVMVVGVSESSQVLLKHMERDRNSAACPVCLVDFWGYGFGSRVEGLPVISGVDKIAGAVKKYKVENVVLADSAMPQDIKDQIRQICRDLGVDLQDFTGYFQGRGLVSLRNLLEYTQGPVELVINGAHSRFDSPEQVLLALTGKYVVNTVSAKDGRIVIDLQKDILVPNDVKEEWAQSYKEETGEDVSFF